MKLTKSEKAYLLNLAGGGFYGTGTMREAIAAGKLISKGLIEVASVVPTTYHVRHRTYWETVRTEIVTHNLTETGRSIAETLTAEAH